MNLLSTRKAIVLAALSLSTASCDSGGGDEVLLIDAEFADDPCIGGTAPRPGLPAGTALHRIKLTAPDAVCNDGSPAVMYVRAAATMATTHNWVFHFQGGGGCGADYDQCRERWCGIGSYNGSKMSSKMTPETIGEKGFTLRDTKNKLGDANQVFVYYCSSDSWAGNKSDAVLTKIDDATKKYRLHFRGHSIAKAAFDQLQGSVKSDDGVITMPPLIDAEQVLITGTSAGSAGATYNVDFLAALFDANKTTVLGVMDADFPPEIDDYDLPNAADFEVGKQANYQRAFVDAYDAPLDSSCLATHDAADRYLCSDLGHLLLNHITTPYFARMDLSDPVISQSAASFGISIVDFAKATRKAVSRVSDVPTTSEEATKMTRTPGIYSPNCGQHEGFTENTWFFVTTVMDSAMKATTFHDALTDWILGNTIAIIDSVPKVLSVCGQSGG